MFRNILSSRGLIVGVVFFVMSVGGSLLYSWHIRRNDAAEMARTNQFLQQLKDKKETRPTQNVGFPVDTKTLEPMKTDDTAPHVSEETEVLPVLDNLADAFLPNDTPVEDDEELDDVPVSPHGFGPYPKVPVDYPNDMTPTWITENGHQSRNHELIDRVLIKLWNQGDKNISGGYRSNKTGRIYPLYPNTVYVRYKEIVAPDGTVHRFIGSNRGTVTLGPSGEVPPGVTVLDLDKEGVDPYNFLGLK